MIIKLNIPKIYRNHIKVISYFGGGLGGEKQSMINYSCFRLIFTLITTREIVKTFP